MAEHWTLLPHVCRACAGRLLERHIPRTATIIRCADCSAEIRAEIGEDGEPELAHTALCACGIETGVSRVRLRCVRNSAPSPEVPSEYAVEEVEVPA